MSPEDVIRIMHESDEIALNEVETYGASVGWSTYVNELITRFGNEFAKENAGFNRAAFEKEFWGG
jgi:hypothetical protein